MLNEMRFGRLSDASITKFRKLKRLPQYSDGIEPTELYVRIQLPVLELIILTVIVRQLSTASAGR